MASVDVRRTVPARLVEDIDAAGQCEPGCVQRIAAGDWTDPTTLSLQPSIYHPATGTPKGCGWHGYLTGGVVRSL